MQKQLKVRFRGGFWKQRLIFKVPQKLYSSLKVSHTRARLGEYITFEKH